MRVSEPIKTAAGFIARTLPLSKWRRHDGLSSFLADMIALRKTLNLCHSCESARMPHRWHEHYDYAFVRGFHAEAIACDRCRQDVPTNMYVAMEGNYARQIREEKQAFENIKRSKRALLEKDTRYFLERNIG